MRKIIIISIIFVVIFVVGCSKQENILAGSEVTVVPAATEPAAKDLSVNEGKALAEQAKQETAIDKALAICDGLKDMRQDWCYQDVSEKSSDAAQIKEICGKVKITGLQIDCLKNAAGRLSDASLCEGIADSAFKAECVAVAGKDCNLIEDEQERDACLEV